MNSLSETLQSLTQSELDGIVYFGTGDLIEALGLGRSTFYKYLKELQLTPRRIKRSTYLAIEEVTTLVEYSQFISQGGNLKGWQERQVSDLSAPVKQGELVAPEPEEEEPTVVELDNLRYLSEAAREKWWLPTGTIATLLDVSPSAIASRGDRFVAYGFEFIRTNHRWKGSIQWSVQLFDLSAKSEQAKRQPRSQPISSS